MTVLKVTNKDVAGAQIEIDLYNNNQCDDLKAECKLFNNTVTCKFLITFPFKKAAESKEQMIFVQLEDIDGLMKPYTISSFYYYKNNIYYAVNDVSLKVKDILNSNSNIWELIGKKIHENGTLHLRIIPGKCIPFKELYEDADFTDFKLYGEPDDTGVTFHRHILAITSPVLKVMLLGEWKESRTGNVQLPLVSKNSLQHLKEYIYLSNVPDSLMDCAKLLCLASYYMLPEIESDIAKKLESVISPENLWQWLEFSIHHKNCRMVLMWLHHFQNIAYQSIVDIEKHFLKGPYKAIFELPNCASRRYYNLYDDKDFIDFQLRTGDDSTYSAVDMHKYMMAAYSPVLKALFLNEWKDADHGYIPSNDVSQLTLQQFKDFIYLQRVPDASKDCAKLIPLAAYYKIPQLERESLLKIADNLKPDNFWEWLEYCIEQKNKYLLVAMLKNIYLHNKIDSVTDYLSKL